jgi:predicted double-glycine peptidase
MSSWSTVTRIWLAGLTAIGLYAGGTHSTAGATSLAAAAPRAAPLQAAGQLGPLLNIPQTWNNCGPASIAEVLAYWGISRTQQQVQAVVRADGNPRGTSPYGVPAYMRSLGMRALLGIAGNERLIKLLVNNGFPVIVSQYVSLADHVGHYRPIQAFNDSTGVFVSSDPYLGQNHVIGYAEFDAIWKSTNRRFMVLYPPGKQALLNQVLGSAGWNLARAFANDLARTQGLLAGRVKDTTGYGSHRNYDLALAWDDLQLGRLAAARQALIAAGKQHASPVVLHWISAEIARATR